MVSLMPIIFRVTPSYIWWSRFGNGRSDSSQRLEQVPKCWLPDKGETQIAKTYQTVEFSEPGRPVLERKRCAWVSANDPLMLQHHNLDLLVLESTKHARLPDTPTASLHGCIAVSITFGVITLAGF